MSLGRVLIVEDESIVRMHLSEILRELGYDVVGDVAEPAAALRLAAQHSPEIALMDIHLRGGNDGVDVARQLVAMADIGIVFVTAFADHETVERTRAVGALGYVVKPYSSDELRAVLATAMTLHRQLANSKGVGASASRVSSSRDAGAPRQEFHGMLAVGEEMQLVLRLIERVAPISWPVLIEGETGTGKELAARAVHAAGPRADGPFVPVNCAALTEGLVGSTFFGHRKGAFTSASTDQVGVFEAAHLGTLFLDEIADIPPAAQKALLRLIEDQTVQRVGDTRGTLVDVRIVSATQRNLAAEAEAGRFRRDLVYRLRGLRISLPPLRDRSVDLPLLAERFLEQVTRELNRGPLSFDADALDCIRAYSWPGNIRELLRAVEYAALASDGQRLLREHLPPELAGVTPAKMVDSGDSRASILDAMRRTKGNRSEAARLLGISRATLYRRFVEHGIDPDALSH